ncbi:MAG: hypothetical protein ABJL67_24225 [Sulfitobacter sp.]
MSIEMAPGLYILFVIAMTFLVALIWRASRAALVMVGLICAALAAPFVYFGSMALILGEPIFETLNHVAIAMTGMLVIARYTVTWAAVGLVSGAAMRAAWLYLRKRSI